jgi:hypothetical protein
VWAYLFSYINRFDKLLIENCYNILTICLVAWKLRKFQGKWSWIGQGCNIIRKTNIYCCKSQAIMNKKLMFGKFCFLYKTHLKFYNRKLYGDDSYLICAYDADGMIAKGYRFLVEF